MCSRREARQVQDAAAEALTLACIDACKDQMGSALRTLYDRTLEEQVPEDLQKLLEKLQ